MSGVTGSNFEFLKRVHELARAAVPSGDHVHLFASQEDAAKKIERSVRALVEDSCAERFLSNSEGASGGTWERRPPRGSSSRAGDVEEEARWRNSSARHNRPHNCFLLNGGRGSGKTTVLNWLVSQLEKLSVSRQGVLARNQGLAHTFGPGSLPEQRSAALVLRVALPNHLEVHEAPMEAVFAAIQNQLLREKAREEGRSPEFARALDKTLKEFFDQVVFGWTFARREGMQALMQDALDFKDFSRNRAKANLYAHMRIESWLGFVDSLLDILGFELLVLVFDDVDLHPEAGRRIVDDIGQYMIHPRIVTIVAADLERLVEGMFRHALTNDATLPRVLGALDNDLQRRNDAQSVEYLANFVSDCRQIALARVDKVFPPGMRYDLDLRDRVQLDKLLDRSFTQLCVEHFFAHWDRRETPPPSTWNQGLAWWHLNAPHSALVTDTVRGYIQFLDGLFHDAYIEHGAEVKLPNADHKNILEVLLSYQKAWGLRSLHASLADLFEMAMRRGRACWAWDQSQQDEPSDPFIDHLIDFWLDVKIATNQLDCHKVPALRRWLPLQLEVPPRKTGKSPLATPPYGINGFLPDSVLPRSCLYVYQFRYLDMLVPLIHRDFDREDNRTLLARLSDDEFNMEFMRSALPQSQESQQDSILQLKSLLMNKGDDNLLLQERLLACHIFLFSNIRHDQGVKINDAVRKLVLKGKNGYFNLSELVWSNGKLAKEDLAAFRIYCSVWAQIGKGDRERDFFRTVWILAVHLGKLGTDYQTLKAPEIAPHLGITFRPGDSGRLDVLADESERIAHERSPRTAVLFAWSLRSVVEPLMRLGCDRADSPEASPSWGPSWGKVQAALEHALTRLDELFPASGKEMPEDTEAPLEPEVRNPENAPERYVPSGRRLEWNFPDFSKAQLETVRSDIQEQGWRIETRDNSRDNSQDNS